MQASWFRKRVPSVRPSDCAQEVTSNAVQIFGGYGYSKEYPVEKLMRDVKVFQIFEGANQVQRLTIANVLNKEYK